MLESKNRNMNWLSKITKEARRYQSNDQVRFFTEGRKGTGKGIVLTPNFQIGYIKDFDPTTNRYIIESDGQVHMVHPRNIVPEKTGQPKQSPQINPISPL